MKILFEKGLLLQRLNYPQHVLVSVLGLVDVDVVEVELVVGGAALVLAENGGTCGIFGTICLCW